MYVLLSVRQSVLKLQTQSTITAGRVCGLAEWIIDGSCLATFGFSSDYDEMVDDEEEEDEEEEDESDLGPIGGHGGQCSLKIPPHHFEANNNNNLLPSLNLPAHLPNTPLPHPSLPSMPLSNLNTPSINNNNNSLDTIHEREGQGDSEGG